jgi:hypothetical protein
MKSLSEWLKTQWRRLEEGSAKLHKAHDPADCIEARLGEAWLKIGDGAMQWKLGDQACVKGTREKVWVRAPDANRPSHSASCCYPVFHGACWWSACWRHGLGPFGLGPQIGSADK